MPFVRRKTRAPKGAEAVREALVSAVIRLLDRKSVAEISVKEIAAEARVNHGLVHRHFGSKEALVREAVERTNARIGREYPEERQASFTLALLRRRPEIARILARCCLDGPRDLLALAAPPPERMEKHLRPIRRLIARLGLEGRIDPNVLDAVGAAALFGWIVFKPLFEAGFPIPPDADERLAEIVALVDAFMDETS
jgi:AcrR family transcriptional regulator